jgi:hypothetical protein
MLFRNGDKKGEKSVTCCKQENAPLLLIGGGVDFANFQSIFPKIEAL